MLQKGIVSIAMLACCTAGPLAVIVALDRHPVRSSEWVLRAVYSALLGLIILSALRPPRSGISRDVAAVLLGGALLLLAGLGLLVAWS